MQRLHLAKPLHLLIGIACSVMVPRTFADVEKSLSDAASKEREALVCDSSKSNYRACIHEHIKKDLFTKATVLQCGETEVVVTTACMDTANGGVYCFNQNLAFLNFSKNGEGIYKNISYIHPSDGAGSPFMADVACIKVGEKYYVRTGSTNFGNCYGCEWSDFFTNRGKYIGSTGSDVYGRTSFLHKNISDALYDRIMNGEWIEQDDGEVSIEIYRVRD